MQLFFDFCGTPDIVKYVHHGFGGGLDNIGGQADAVEAAADDVGEPVLRREGHRSGSWVLLDYGCVIVHVFQDEARKFYDLERLWSDAEVVDISDMRA